MEDNFIAHKFLNWAQSFAEVNSTCQKVKVGCVVIPYSHESPILGCNHGVGYSCTNSGCRRVKLYGEASKEHRLPSDCEAIHSEVDAICRAAENGISLSNATIFVTRYPCEACARAIVQAGIRKIQYGRKESISETTKRIFDSALCEVTHVEGWDWEDNNS